MLFHTRVTGLTFVGVSVSHLDVLETHYNGHHDHTHNDGYCYHRPIEKDLLLQRGGGVCRVISWGGCGLVGGGCGNRDREDGAPFTE